MRLNKFLSFSVVPLIALSLSGCVFLVAGTVGAVGGYAVTRDTMQGEYDAPFIDAWKASVKVCGVLGTVTLKDAGKGALEALVDRAKVKVEVTQLTPESVRIKVKARKGIFPRLGTAEKILVKIVQELM